MKTMIRKRTKMGRRKKVAARKMKRRTEEPNESFYLMT